ncbi:MAG: hypothetical protein IKK17_07980, partial [Oscillospiraceae bacterium]|nr:hypothetical protein [Oscillospiraceae bacterium]
MMKRRRLFALLLALVMVISLAPMSAFAADGEPTEIGAADVSEPLSDVTEPAPVCTCAEACTTENFNEYCVVCGVDYSKCTGTDTAAAYAEGDKVSVTINGETTYYTSIKDAVAKANESGNATITLLQDTTTGERLDITNSATLDLNGNTLSCTAYFADDYETMVAVTTNGAKLTIIDSVGGGKLDGTGTDYALMLGEPGAYTARSASAYIDGSTVSGSVKTVSGTSMTVSGSTVESNSVVA